MLRPLLLILILILLPVLAWTQSPLIHGNSNVWFFGIAQYQLTKKFRVGNELHLRRDAFLRDQQQSLIRPLLAVRVHENIDLAAGYSFVRTSPYGDFPMPVAVNEHNVWEQITLLHAVDKWKLQHRHRLENRFLPVISLDSSSSEYAMTSRNLAHRYRYRLTGRRDINDQLFVHLFNELWFSFDRRFRTVNFDRNWASAGLGYRFAPVGNVQIAYMHQYIRNTADRYERHPTLLLSLEINLNREGK